jgi:glycosyltransferase involved in cell wall biosynthesis
MPARIDSTKPNLLYLSPTIPAPTGHGSAIRADIMLEVLARRYNIFLFVYHLYKERLHQPDAARLSERCADVVILPRATAPHSVLAALLAFTTRTDTFDVVHVFRLCMARLIGDFLRTRDRPRPKMVLDLDDHESKARLRLAALLERAGDMEAASAMRGTAHTAALLEGRVLPEYDLVCVSNPDDVEELAERHKNTTIRLVPNAVRVPPSTPANRSRVLPTLLFVGTMHYYPNEDGVVFFCSEALPLLRERFGRPFRVMIVGTRPSERVLALRQHSEVVVTGEVPDVEEYYRAADVVIVPIRAGGGTRIKILEACAHRKPIVSTPLGAEGLGVTHGRELLIAETATELAACCEMLLTDPRRAECLATAGYEWVRSQHTPLRVARALGI